MTKHIGIAACSAEGASLCYLTVCIEGPNLLEGYAHPEVTMHTHSLDEYLRPIDVRDWEKVADLMLASAHKLAQAGADFAICPDNTCHNAFDLVAARSPIPWLHIAEEVAAEAKRRSFQRLGVLGTCFLMEGPVYDTKLDTAGIGHVIPEVEDRERINRIIFDELIRGQFTAQSGRYFTEVIGRLKDRGCDAVVLGCTEIPLIVTEENSPLPVLDSTRLLARGALREAIKA
jgi:aspartate racemase